MIDLLVVIAIIGILAAMILPALAKAKEAGMSARCKSNLRQMGIGVQVYADNNRSFYPSSMYSDAIQGVSTLGAHAGPVGLFWFNDVYSASFKSYGTVLLLGGQTQWTNRLYHCPTYVQNGDLVFNGDRQDDPGIFESGGSCSYNEVGMVSAETQGSDAMFGLAWHGTKLLLNNLHPRPTAQADVASPSDLFMIGDGRPSWQTEMFNLSALYTNGWVAFPTMQPFSVTITLSDASMAGYLAFYSPSGQERPPPHSANQCYNMVYADGHVAPVKRRDYLYPPVAASHWNIDNQSNPDYWEWDKTKWAPVPSQ